MLPSEKFYQKTNYVPEDYKAGKETDIVIEDLIAEGKFRYAELNSETKILELVC